jgi:uncharacterized RDD family membrane protein YckC
MNASNPYAPPQAAVADVADPNASAARADRGTRLLAALVDGLVFMAMVYIPLAIGLGMAGAGAAIGASTDSAMPFNFAALFGTAGLLALAGLIAWVVITYRLVARNGQTIAKKWFGIKVVRSDGSKASVGRIFWLRNVVNAILGVIPLYGLIDILWIFGEERRCLHDKIADTIVIKA